MRKRNRTVRLLIGAGAAILVLVGCSTSSTTSSSTTSSSTTSSSTTSSNTVAAPAELVTKDVLTYGVAASFPPFEYREANGDLAGFDVEFGAALGEVMGLTVTPIDMDFQGLILALNGKRVDVINSAMYINPEREAQVDFVPYMQIGEAILVPAGNPKNVSTLDDLSGLTVAVTQGAIEAILVEEHNEILSSQGIPEIKMLQLATGDQDVQALLNGRADAMLTSTPGAAAIQSQVPGKLEMAGTFANDTVIGLAVRKGDKDMHDTLTKAVAALNENGELAKIAEKYNLPVESLVITAGK